MSRVVVVLLRELLSRLPMLLPLFVLVSPARAELVVVTNASNGVAVLSRDDVINIFMGRYRVFPNGSAAHPLDAAADSVERDLFYRRLLGKSQPEVKAYWARLIFSGHTLPPRQLPSLHALLAAIEGDPGALAYVDRRNVSRQMTVVFSLSE